MGRTLGGRSRTELLRFARSRPGFGAQGGSGTGFEEFGSGSRPARDDGSRVGGCEACEPGYANM
ncbi:hypothetical protein GCM10009532_01700 [Microbacterium aurantiacum]